MMLQNTIYTEGGISKRFSLYKNIESMTKTLCFICSILCFSVAAQYTGTASVTRGLATTTATNLYTCAGGRVTNVGKITGTDNKVWTVPAATNFTNTAFPFASNLHNVCVGANYANATAALAALNGSDIVTIDTAGEVITAFVFADNYFEMYINGVPVGKDNVPFTQFNSNILRFKVKRPFTIALLLVDWEEHLGIGTEVNGGFSHHAGDGGVVAIFKDANNRVVAKTDNTWKAQTFYTAPIKDLTCATENGTARLSTNCSTTDSNDGSLYYALHWEKPSNWMSATFNDASWQAASTYTNTTIGVDNKPAYVNFTNIFDDPTNDAQFIWSKNVILDNEVVVRYTVPAASTRTGDVLPKQMRLYPNPVHSDLNLEIENSINAEDFKNLTIYNALGTSVFSTNAFSNTVSLNGFANGVYVVQMTTKDSQFKARFIKH
jgi:hypothetical protein